MSRYHSYINSAKEILGIYRGDEPLSTFLKKYFSANKKYGSKDRKQVAHLCYCFFRLGKTVMNTSIEEKMLTALFLCCHESNETLAALKPEWNEKCELPVNEKLLIINYSLIIQNVFPWKDELSEGIDHDEFCQSFFIQPDVFLRVRPGETETVIKKLQIADCRFQIAGHDALSLPNAVKLESILEIDKEVVIQDLNSQIAGELLKAAIRSRWLSGLQSKIHVWDCCAGSGGKSIMAFDMDPKIKLIVSDTRESILANLKKRFASAGITNYESFVIDLANKSAIRNLKSEIIIADVPCSGSGTWSRTPEQLYFFQKRKIEEFSALQKRIVSTAIPQLQPGGSFVYITCSVFKKENEEVVTFIKENFHLKLKQMEVLKGYDKKADSMFVALFEKEL